MTAVVRDARPPTAMVAAINPILRALLRTPFARLAKHLALLEFSGRRSGRRYRVPVGWHQADGVPVVFTPAPWRANFQGGAPTTVHHRGRSQHMTRRSSRTPQKSHAHSSPYSPPAPHPASSGSTSQPGTESPPPM
jgi:hypothetical protein